MKRADAETRVPDPGTGATPDPQEFAEIDRMVHEPSRLLILAVLSNLVSADFLFLAGQTAMTRGNLSSHLAKLEQAGYVSVQKAFVGKVPRTTLLLTPRGRDAYERYTAHMNGLLGRLK